MERLGFSVFTALEAFGEVLEERAFLNGLRALPAAYRRTLLTKHLGRRSQSGSLPFSETRLMGIREARRRHTVRKQNA
jgi:hypothetical protein